ncbi:MAG TPA: prohibitin family protein [Aggregatilinea sp.]|jgi:regulator of protease activity HflC (stomatin/prohibitin superfamily)|uniref:prohibitin family protein n=1 Tax=Aggregatilinea sp. TaxID=2806333 RepID=UPI002C59745B|nr:prohibitin family protein [Aggregatilinea sp.]HML24606.1 prohibitin family protein [Aggregatilinea sp.]
MIGPVLSVVAIAGLALAGFGVFMIVQALQRNQNARSGAVLTVIGVLVAVVFFVLNSGLVEVKANEVGVVFNVLSGDLSETPIGPGLHVIIPGIQEVTIYSTAQQEYTMSGDTNEGAIQGDDAVTALTQDGQQVRIDVTVLYRINPASVNQLHLSWQNRYQDGLVRATVRNQVRGSLTQFRVEEIYGTEHDRLQTQIEDGVRKLVEDDGLEVINVLIRNITFSPEYVAAIEQKQVAQQQAQEAEFRVQQREQEAEQQRALARGDADAARIRAEGETAALELINQQLSQNPLLIQWRYVETLSDNVQMILLPSNSPFLFDIQSLTEQAGIQMPSTSTSPTPSPTPEAGASGSNGS